MKCNENNNCVSLGCGFGSIIISIILAVAFAILYNLSLIPITLNFIIVAIVTTVITLAILLATIVLANVLKDCENPFKECLCENGSCVLAGVVGTFLATTAALVVGVTEVTVASTIIVGLSMLFFVFMVIQIFKLINCVIEKSC